MLATLQYTVLEEALLVIHHVDRLVSIQGGMLLDQLGAVFDDRQSPRAGAKSLASMRRGSAFAYAMGLLLDVKQHLKRCYQLSDARCADFDPGNTTNKSQPETPAVRQHDDAYTLPAIPVTLSNEGGAASDFRPILASFNARLQQDAAGESEKKRPADDSSDAKKSSKKRKKR